jgi:hypothetical protein
MSEGVVERVEGVGRGEGYLVEEFVHPAHETFNFALIMCSCT